MIPELIAPGGSYQKARQALIFGADSVYVGLGSLSLRGERLNRVQLDDIARLIKFAGSLNKKIYVTANIFAHNRHLKPAANHFKQLAKLKPDGIILSNPGMLEITREYCPKIPIHLSTQANTTNWKSVKFWLDQGITRIVLARELSLPEVAEIHRRVPRMELEYFVHGAMCASYSGRCYLSHYFTGRSANLGDCTQPCRWRYNVYLEEKERLGQFLPIEEEGERSYILNSQDLCLIKQLDDLKKAGVNYFKIEGRTKSIYYVSMVSKIYRQAINLPNNKNKTKKINQLYKELQTLNHREYSTGFLLTNKKPIQKLDSSHILPKHQFVGEVTKTKKEKHHYLINIKVHNTIKLNEALEFIQPYGLNIRLKIKKMIDTKDNKPITEAHGGCNTIIQINAIKKITPYSVARKKI